MSGHADDGVLRLRVGAALWHEVDNETIVLDPVGGRYMGVNEAGSTLWSALSRGATHSELVQLLHNEYGVPQAEASLDVTEFVAECRRLGYIAPQ